MSIERQTDLFIGGRWVPARGVAWADVVNPATEKPIASVRSAGDADVDDAVHAARAAFEEYSLTSVDERIKLLERLLEAYERRRDDFAAALTREMGAPTSLARGAQADLGVAHLRRTIEAVRRQELEEVRGTSRIICQPAGVAALITPWNWPVNQVFTKAASALGAGCTMVLKPSEYSPLDAVLFAEIVEEAGVPPGVFNLVFGEGPTVGSALARHPGVDVVSFTGSTRAGRQILRDAADTIKMVHLELGGKSPNVILDDADLETAVRNGVAACFSNSGQSCSVATRMIVPAHLLEDVVAIARKTAEEFVTGDPTDEATALGPLINDRQFAHVQRLIQSGIDGGARLVTGGLGRPAGLERGYFVRPTVFADVTPAMRIAQEEIFGPVLSILTYDTEDEAVRIANDSIYGLAAVVQSADRARAVRVARRIQAGHVYINHEFAAYAAMPFGGWKQSGNGYEHDEWGVRGFQILKAVLGAEE
ncbi:MULTISPECIES: aldehyde dehydrogenase family protein [unclassified Parafrankia]|uniref:aldehyde dehydrogenase family protein n=1 Tax=unclassified Parafrankia TaxID=2994368 RepID=UPI000DA4C219|nr:MULTISPECIES: aldehyde dehydrogenase family protein [unclassified Parafrankia]TCJ33499.1 aldehyde dehydrogenase family protein [Parafrankia sp. BMG5.11]SQD97732.1 3-succinoylsemialdehyde-pyridine dehydrogenase [Parafrankia sp. Ea1.12]